MSRQPFTSCWALAAGLFLGAAGAAAQSNVGPGEQRFNAGIYKASHNSYERGESMDSQIDNWNCWCVELDLFWDAEASLIWVEHFCYSSHDERLLDNELIEIAASSDADERVTVVYLELKNEYGSPCYEDWPNRDYYRAIIQYKCESFLGEGTIYTAQEFKGRDQNKWPSYQELLRRGYRWVVILDEAATGLEDSDFFFGVGRGNPPMDSNDFKPNSVLINIDGGTAVPDRSTAPDRWLFRSYPGGSCGDDDDEGYFYGAIDRGYNFIATNCIDQSHTMHQATHSPSPVHVRLSGGTTVYGTRAFPYLGPTGLVNAAARASPMVPIRIGAGEYDVPNGAQFSRGVVLKAEGGLVRIR